ncbi:MAG: hypothetical protein OXG35_03360, partial [Acidobacteria bacterium]|nr:hypothetical protein [Acidobacteriota bacterium]
MGRSALVVGVRIAAVSAVCVLAASGAAAQAVGGNGGGEAAWETPRTAWGAPDLQGVWDYRTMTPLERPREFAGKAVMSEEEAAAFTARTLEEQADYDRAPSVHAKWWLDYGKELTEDRRTSLVVDPPDGRIPALTPEGQRQEDIKRDWRT